MSKVKNEKGITMIALVITIMALSILAIVIVANTNDMVETKNLLDLKSDISNLTQKVTDFYNEYGELPADIEYTNVSNLTNVLNDEEKTSKFYVIDLQAMQGISLNYGRDYEHVKNTNTQTANKYSDLYIINVSTHNIFYAEGVSVAEEGRDRVYYTSYEEPENITKVEISSGLKPGETATGENKEYVDTESGKTATIPEGFTVSDKDGETNINNGLVVIAPDGSEFVWIPVDDVNTMATKTSGTDANGNENYQGKLYNFSSDLTSTERTRYGQGTTSYREPDVVTGSSGTSYDASSTYLSPMNTILGTTYASSDDFKTDLQKDYNSMVKSVNTYYGFYVGRYETSFNTGTSKVQSKQGETSADASQMNTYRWYGLYARQKLYSTSSVQGSMIWGSQWDAMLRWMQGNNIDVTSSTPTDAATGITASYNKTKVTGGANSGETDSKDRLNNVYDLLGNTYEWILEAYRTSFRVLRGGYYNSGYPPESHSDGSTGSPSGDYSYYGSRLALYLR